MFHAYIILDCEPKSNNFYCLSPACAANDATLEETSVLLHCQRKPTDPENMPLVTAKQLYTFIDGKIISMYTGDELNIDSADMETNMKWKLMSNGQIRTMSNYCITATQQNGEIRDVITLEKQTNESPVPGETKLQKWRIVTKI